MGSPVLVESMIVDGRRIVSRLRSIRFAIYGAFWARLDENSSWCLYLVTPTIRSDGLGEAYTQLYKSIADLDKLSVQFSDISLINEDDKLAKIAKEMTNRHIAKDFVRLEKYRTDFRTIEEMYIYTPYSLQEQLGKAVFSVTYQKTGLENTWTAETKLMPLWYARGLDYSGVISHTTGLEEGQTEKDATFAIITVVVDTPHLFDAYSDEKNETIFKTLKKHARLFADIYFKAKRPDAIIAED